MITHVSIKNFKSLSDVNVDLAPLTVLVGKNGTGKSNFIDALRFVSDTNQLRLDQAVKNRDGIDAILHKFGRNRSDEIEITIDFELFNEHSSYSFEIATATKSDYRVVSEGFKFDNSSNSDFANLDHKTGKLQASKKSRKIRITPSESKALILLPLLSLHGQDVSEWALQAVLSIDDFFRQTRYYAISPIEMRKAGIPQNPTDLSHDGSNIASVLDRLQTEVTEKYQSLVAFLSQAVPDVNDIIVRNVDENLFVRFKHRANDHEDTELRINQESDGTLWLLGNLVALHQDPAPKLILIEEPESMIHPGALLTVYEAMKEASLRTQIVVSTHSPDLLHAVGQDDPGQIRVVEKIGGATQISPLDHRQVEIINEELSRTSDLLRIQGLRPESH